MRRLVAAIGCVTVMLSAGCAEAARPVAAPDGPRFVLSPDGASITEPVDITVDGLALGDEVRVWARTLDRSGHAWESSSEFVANGIGQVDVTGMPSTGGTYTGVDPNGLFWSMRPTTDQPVPYPLTDADDMILELGVDRGGQTIARTTLRREVRDPRATVHPVEANGLVGDLYLPDDRGSLAGPSIGHGPGEPTDQHLPGVLLLGGAEGGRPDPGYASLLAAQGFAVFGLAYFGEPGLPDTLSRIPVEYGQTAARWLAEQPAVAGPRVGVVGVSEGATYGLLLASTEPDRFGAVVAHAPSDVVWPALDFDAATPPVSSFTRNGRDLPFLDWAPGANPDRPPSPGQTLVLAPTYAAARTAAAPEQRDRARVRVEKITAPVLLTSGGRDGIWPSATQAARLAETITEADHEVAHLDFPKAGHFVGAVPGQPTTSTAVRYGPVTAESGGDPAFTAEAARTTFPATVDLLGRLRPAS